MYEDSTFESIRVKKLYEQVICYAEKVRVFIKYFYLFFIDVFSKNNLYNFTELSH